MKLRNAATGVTVEVSKETADLLPSEYEPAGSEKKPAAKKAAEKRSSDDEKK